MIKRYRFTNKEVADTKLATITNEDGTYNDLVVVLGKIIDTPPTYEGEELIQEATYLEGYHVDILFNELTESPYGFKQYEVEPNTPKHVFL